MAFGLVSISLFKEASLVPGQSHSTKIIPEQTVKN